MKKRLMFAAVAISSLVATPVLAANPAASLSVAKAVRASAPTQKKSELLPGVIVGAVLAVGIVVGGIVVATEGDDDSDSN